MIDREKIKKEIVRIVERNKLEKCFLPIIEEFFFRVASQCNWEEADFRVAICNFEKVKDISFVNFGKSWLGLIEKNGQTTYELDDDTQLIEFDVNLLKDILKFNYCKIQEFIDTAMHEQGHALQFKRDTEDLLYVGINIWRRDVENGMWIDERANIMNEFAETINANRLQYGKINRRRGGYISIQNAGRIVLSSLGISELELANLQFKGRQVYEDVIAKRLGFSSYKMYLDSFEQLLDSIWKFADDRGLRENLVLQISGLQNLSKAILEERFDYIMKNSNDKLGELAKLTIDSHNRDDSLMNLFYEFDITQAELQMDERN